MNSYVEKLIQKYKFKGVLTDTNLLLLYLVGSFDIELIGSFKRTSRYSIDDFYNVSNFLQLFEKKIVTPHILTEVSDFIDNRRDLQLLLKTFIEKGLEEKFIKSEIIVQNKEFIDFGLADTATMEIGKNSYLIFTDDNPLYGFLVNSQIDAVNLDQIRGI